MTRSIAVALAGACLLACSSLDPGPTVVLRNAARLAEIDCIAVLPVASYPAVLEGNEEALAAFGEALRAELLRRGYRVVPAPVMVDLLQSKATERGINLRPGHAAQVELEALHADACAALHEVHGAQALLQPSFEWREAPISGVHAVWDGCWESIEYRRNDEGVGAYPRSIRGSVTALSLRVRVEDPAREALYEAYGGVHVRTRLDRFLNPIEVPPRELFADPERIERAVAVALEGLGGA